VERTNKRFGNSFEMFSVKKGYERYKRTN